MVARRVTEYEYRQTGDQQVIKTLRDIGQTAETSADKFEQSIRKPNAGLKALDTTIRTTQNSVKSLSSDVLKFGTGLFAAQGIISGFGAATAAMKSFEAELANVGTLGNQSEQAIEGFRTGLIALDSRLGTTTELTQGLYQTLSAGIANNPLEFLETSARFATAALTDTRTAVDVLSTVTNAYGLSASSAAESADVLFKTIEIGKTTGEELGTALGRVIPLAAALNIELEDVAAATATLTAGGLKTDEAITGLRSAFAQLIVNAKAFREAGIDVNAVLGREGLQGLLEDVRESTRGSSTDLRKLISDTEGFTAALALTGKQFDTFVAGAEKIAGAENSVLTAFERQTNTATAATEAFFAELDRFAQTVAPAILPPLTAITQGLGAVVRLFRGVGESRLDEIRAEIAKTDVAIENLNTSFLRFLTPDFLIDNNIKKLQEQRKELEATLDVLQSDIGEFLDFPGAADQQRAAAAAKEREKVLEQQKAADRERAKVLADELAKAETEHQAVADRVNQEILNRQIRFAEDLEDAVLQSQARQRDAEIEANNIVFQKRIDLLNELDRERAASERRNQLEAERRQEEVARKQEQLEEEANRRRQRFLDSITDDFAEVFFQGLREGEDGALDAFKAIVNRIIAEKVFAPLFENIFLGVEQAVSAGATQGAGNANVSRARAPAQVGTTGTTGGDIAERSRFQSFGSSLAGTGQAIGTADFVQGTFSGGDFTNTTTGRALHQLGLRGSAHNVLSGAASGAAAGSQFGGYAAAVGGVLGAITAGINEIFGDSGQNVKANLITSGRVLSRDVLSDRASVRSPFGEIGFRADDTARLDAAGAARTIRDIDVAVANIINDRQEALVTAALQDPQVPNPQARGASEQDVVARLLQDRFSTILDTLGGEGVADRIFGDIEATGENIDNLAQTFEEAVTVLAAIDNLRNPTEPLTAAEVAIRDINEVFDELTNSAEKFGFSTAELEIERQRQLRGLTEDFNASIDDQILAFTDPFALAMKNLTERQEERLREAEALEADTTDILRLNLLEREELERQFAENEFEIRRQSLKNLQSLLLALPGVTQAERQLISLQNQFDNLKRAAEEAGFGVDDITLAFEDAKARLREEGNRDIERRILAFTDPFERAVQDLFDRQATEFREASAAGLSIHRLLQAQRFEQVALFEQLTESLQAGTSEITDFLNSLSISEQSGFDIGTRIENAQRLFEAALRGTDESAAVEAGSQLLDLFRDRFASSADFIRERDAIIASLTAFRSRLEQEQTEDRPDLETFLERFEAIQTQQTADPLRDLREEVTLQSNAQVPLLMQQVELQNRQVATLERSHEELRQQTALQAATASAINTLRQSVDDLSKELQTANTAQSGQTFDTGS